MNDDLKTEYQFYMQYQDYVMGGKMPSLKPLQIERMERYTHVVDLLKQYSFNSDNARGIHKKKYDLTNAIVNRDFYVAYYVFGQINVLDQESNRAWLTLRLQTEIDKARAVGDFKAVAMLAKEYKEVTQLHLKKDESTGPIELPPSEITVHAKALEYKKNPKLLEKHMKVWLQPKKKIQQYITENAIEDAQVISDGQEHNK